ncbi:MAG: hypothetical protein AAFO94_15135, partial [Bacteroidota bacterium]
WGKSLDAIAEARDLILNKYQLYPNLAAKIKALNPAPDLPKEKVLIPANRKPKESLFSKLKKLINA